MPSFLFPRITIAALKGSSGKTFISLGLIAALRKKGHAVIPFKKGPDFIDAGWLAHAGGRPCHNLDAFLLNRDQILQSFLKNADPAGVSLIEGNRGLFDGLDLEGHCSTAELAKMLSCPVLIIVDVTMSTRTIAAMVMGCQRFDPELQIGGIILNKVATHRQESLICRAIEHYCDLPIIGAIPKLGEDHFPQRHMGLVPYHERFQAEDALNHAGATVEKYLDLEKILKISHAAGSLAGPVNDSLETTLSLNPKQDRPVIGIMRDPSFWFYYPENLDQLREAGAELRELNSLEDQTIPALDGLYIGGGFPETQAATLAENHVFRDLLKQMIEAGLPVYAECGGLLYLSEGLMMDDRFFPMVGVLPIRFCMEGKPQGHGYTLMEVEYPNPYYAKGELIRGHEFHYSRPIPGATQEYQTLFKVRRGHGLDGVCDGIFKKNLLATYTHIHAAGNPLWAQRFVKVAVGFKMQANKFCNYSSSQNPGVRIQNKS